LSEETPSGPGSLDGLRVLCVGNFVAGNTFTMTLAELGAEAVKVESHNRPDAVRSRFATDHPETHEPSGVETTALFGGLARSTRDLSIDMKAPGARELFARLLQACDVLAENQGPTVLSGWGFGWEDVHRINPRLVMVSISGYGRTGPRSQYLAYGGNICSFAGLTYLWGVTHGTIFDYVAGSHAVAATLAALELRDRTGEGTYVDLGQVEAAGAVMGPLLLSHLNGGPPTPPPGNEVAGAWLSAVVACAGPDRWLAVEVTDAAQWQALAGVLGQPAAETQPTDEERARMRSALADWAAFRTDWPAAADLQAAGVPAAPVQYNDDIWRDPQLRARGQVVPVTHPDLGTIEYPAPPHHMSRTPARVYGPAPRAGQHTRYVLRRWAGLDADEVERLVRTGVVATDDPAPAP
jgi:crotonobetainyl-CoA:carnitine CoA-transferase CaiB-like acyl-CoA transferase